MRAFIVLFCASIIICIGNLGSLENKQPLENKTLVISPTPQANLCKRENYKHKSAAEIAAMKPSQRVDEYFKESRYHIPLDDDMGSFLGNYVRKDHLKALPRLVVLVNEVEGRYFDVCPDAILQVIFATEVIYDIDNLFVRLRGIPEGRVAIGAHERVIQRMIAAGVERREIERVSSNLKSTKGINRADQAIRNTLRLRNRISFSENEFEEFISFLITRDPTYPSWSLWEFVKDFSHKDDSGVPFEVEVMVKPDRFYKTYLKFKKMKRKQASARPSRSLSAKRMD